MTAEDLKKQSNVIKDEECRKVLLIDVQNRKRFNGDNFLNPENLQKAKDYYILEDLYHKVLAKIDFQSIMGLLLACLAKEAGITFVMNECPKKILEN